MKAAGEQKNSLNHKTLSNDDPFIKQRNQTQKESILFREEILKEVKDLQKIINDTTKFQLEIFDKKYINKFDNITSQLSQISQLISFSKDLKEKQDDLITFKNKSLEKFTNFKQQLTFIQYESKDLVKNLEKMIQTQILYPDLIGKNGKFRTFHLFVDYVLSHLKTLIDFKENNNINSYANKVFSSKLESLSQGLKSQMNNVLTTSKQFSAKFMDEFEEKMNIKLEEQKTKLIETNKESFDKISSSYDKINQKIYNDVQQMITFNKDIINRYDNEINELKEENKKVKTIIDRYRKVLEILLNEFKEYFNKSHFNANIKGYFNESPINYSKEKDKITHNKISYLKLYISGKISLSDLLNKKIQNSNNNEKQKIQSKQNAINFNQKNKNHNNSSNNIIKDREEMITYTFNNNKTNDNIKEINKYSTINIPKIRSSKYREASLSSKIKKNINKRNSILLLDSFSQKIKNEYSNSLIKKRPSSVKNSSYTSDNYIMKSIDKIEDKIIITPHKKNEVENSKNVPLLEIKKVNMFNNNGNNKNKNELYFLIPNQKITDGIGTGRKYKVKKPNNKEVQNNKSKKDKVVKEYDNLNIKGFKQLKHAQISKSIECNKVNYFSNSDINFYIQNYKKEKYNNEGVKPKNKISTVQQTDKLLVKDYFNARKRIIISNFDLANKNEEKQSKDKSV